MEVKERKSPGACTPRDLPSTIPNPPSAVHDSPTVPFSEVVWHHCVSRYAIFAPGVDPHSKIGYTSPMKTTRYFDYIRSRPDRRIIQDAWISQVIQNPIHRIIQKDGRIRLWGRIREADNRILRVVLLADRETVHNAFFDRSFKEA